jgi:DivIVA domain-containing protein
MRKKNKDVVDDSQDFSGLPVSTTVTPAGIQQKEFRVSRFGGYRMRDVDEFLDQITEAMTKLTDDNERLRSAGGLPATSARLPIGAPDLADTSRQADEIIARARAEAATILREAREQAVKAAGGPTTDAGRAAVAAFLAQERDFLQQLGSLVQGHAESVKGMAKASRGPKPAQAPEAAEPVEPPAPSGPLEVTDAPEPADVPKPTEPIRLEEPAAASVAAGESDEEKASGEGGDPSLRELFWGEE